MSAYRGIIQSENREKKGKPRMRLHGRSLKDIILPLLGQEKHGKRKKTSGR